jgi:hypothetical protein
MLVAILFLLKTEEEQIKTRPPNVIYEVVLTWDGKSNDDLDLWVRSASGHTVGFNNREGGDGSLISLDHDALGRSTNNRLLTEGVVVSYNEEVVSFRGVTAGENIVNVHVYRKVDKEPIKATVTLIKIKPYKQIIIKQRHFIITGEERTAFRFKTDKNGKIVDINELPAKIINLQP